MIDVAIIGGGVSGLAAAYALTRKGRRVVVLERQARAGGNAISENIGGFLMEHGPSTVATESEAARALSTGLGLDGSACNLGEGVQKRYLVGDGRLQGIAVHPMGFFTSNYLSLGARLRVLGEPFIRRKAASAGETIADFCTRRFGGEFTSRVIDPLVGGIYAGCASQLSATAAFPRMVELERKYGSIGYGMLRRRFEGGRMPGSRLFSWQGGIGTLPRAMAEALGGAVHTNVAVRRIERRASGFRIDAGQSGKFDAAAVIVATQPSVAAGLLEGIDATAADAAGSITVPPLAVVFFGFRREQVEHPLDGLGFLVPQDEGRSLSGAQFCSTMFPGRAPEGCVAVAGYFGGARAPQIARLSGEELIGLAREEFADLIGARGEPVVARVRHWPLGLPQYEIGHEDRVGALQNANQRQSGLFIVGNYFAGPGIGNCLTHAMDAAARVDNHLTVLSAERAPAVHRKTGS